MHDFIASGVVSAGDKLPTEAELCERYSVSRITVRAALRGLRATGLITVRQGHGSTVLPRADTIISGLDRLCSFDTFARDSGRKIETAELEIEETAADKETAGRLEISEGTPVVVVKRLKLYGSEPVAWIVDYLPTSAMDADEMRRRFEGSVLDVLLEEVDLHVEYSDMDVVPVNVEGELAARLRVPDGRAALYLDELTCTRDGEVINWSKAWLLPDHLRFRLRRRRNHDFTEVD